MNVVVGIKPKATQMKASHKGFLSSSVSINTKATATNIASNLSANNLTLKTTKEIKVRTPYEALEYWYNLKPDLFIREPDCLVNRCSISLSEQSLSN
jgi:hypothetical protein